MILKNIKYNTTPIVLHYNSSPYPEGKIFDDLQSLILSSPRRYKNSDQDITIFTWNNQIDKGCFENSLDALGISYFVLGRDVSNWENLVKIRLTYEFLKTVDTTYVMAADSRDVLLIDDPKILIERLESLSDCLLLFNAERNHYPPQCRTKMFEEQVFKKNTRSSRKSGETSFPFLNSGVWIGRTDFCRDLHNEALEINPPEADDDQGVYKILYKRHYPSIQIDHDCSVFQTLFMIGDDELELINNRFAANGTVRD